MDDIVKVVAAAIAHILVAENGDVEDLAKAAIEAYKKFDEVRGVEP